VNAELGVAYFAAWLQDYPLAAALAALGLVATATLRRWRPVRGAFFHLALALVLFTTYVGWAGGDYMALYRFVMPVLPLAALLGAAALLETFRRVEATVPPGFAGGFGRVALAAVALVALAGGGWVLWLPSQRSVDGVESAKRLQTVKGMRRNSQQWVQAGRSVHDALPADVTIATTAAGALPYFAGQRCIDQSGLCDRYTAKVDSDPWFLDRVGHMKQATRKHLAELKPAAIFWHPVIETVERFVPTFPPTPDYDLRALRVQRLEDEPRFLWFWARRDALAGWKGRGVLTRDEAANLAREERAAAAKAVAQAANGHGANGGAPRDGKSGPPAPELRVTHDFLVPKSAAGTFVTRRLHELDPTTDEMRVSVEDVSRPLWGADGSCDVTLSGAPHSGIEFELASAGDDKTLPGLTPPDHVEVRFEADGVAAPLQVYSLPAMTKGARAWKRFRADVSNVKGAGRLVLSVGGKPAGPSSGFLASIPRRRRCDAAQEHPHRHHRHAARRLPLLLRPRPPDVARHRRHREGGRPVRALREPSAVDAAELQLDLHGFRLREPRRGAAQPDARIRPGHVRRGARKGRLRDGRHRLGHVHRRVLGLRPGLRRLRRPRDGRGRN